MSKNNLKKDKAFLKGRMESVVYAVRGAFLLLKYEHSVITQLVIASLFCLAGFYFEISAVEWMIQILAIGLVLATEGLNTAVEKLCDFVHPDFEHRIGVIKDLAAGAVLFAAMAAIVVGCIIYLPKLTVF